MNWMLIGFCVLLVVFHGSEVWFVHSYNPEQLSRGSLLVTPPYLAVLAMAVIEYQVELRYLPKLKQLDWLAIIGLAMAVLGDTVRKTAIITAGRHFTHVIAEEKRDGHALVQTGIYRFLRHPGYAGWLLWAVGMHVLLLNPVSTLITVVAGWRFLRTRVRYEEAKLREFFPGLYDAYRERTPTFIPFIGDDHAGARAFGHPERDRSKARTTRR